MIRQQVPSQPEEILDEAVKGEEVLQLTSRLESAHLPFRLAGGPMQDFETIVGVSFGVVGCILQIVGGAARIRTAE